MVLAKNGNIRLFKKMVLGFLVVNHYSEIFMFVFFATLYPRGHRHKLE